MKEYQDILRIIAQAAKKLETVEIWYPKTENTPPGWREVEPYSLSTDIGEEGEHLIYNQDRLSPGHIFNARTLNDEHCDSFIIGKIKEVRLTNKSFNPRWPVEFPGADS
jgi:hypothetical protein